MAGKSSEPASADLDYRLPVRANRQQAKALKQAALDRDMTIQDLALTELMRAIGRPDLVQGQASSLATS